MLILVNMTSSSVYVYTVLFVNLIWILTIYNFDFLFIFDMTMKWILNLNAHTRFTHLTGCKVQVCVFVSICSSLSMTFSCVCVYTVLFVNLIWILTIYYFDFLFVFDVTLSIEFSMHTLGSHLIGWGRFKFVYLFIYAHLCQWLPPPRIHCSVCQSIMNTHHITLLLVHFQHDYQLDFYTHSVHISS